jgi:hypothetical protein
MLVQTFGSLVSSIGLAIAGVWLCLLGQWASIGVGLLALAIGIPLARSPFLIAPAKKGFQLGGLLFPALSTLYQYVVVTVWCVGIIWLSVGQVTRQAAMLPAVVWAYGAVLWPWHFSRMLVLPEGYYRDSEMSYYSCSLWFINLACIVVGSMFFFAHPTFLDAAGVFTVTMTGALFTQVMFLRRIHQFHLEEKLKKIVEKEVENRMRSILPTEEMK